VIAYSYDLKNTGNVSLDAPFTVADDKATVTCPATPTSLAPGASIICTASYIIAQEDLDAGSVKNTAQGQGYFGETAVPSNEDSETVTAIQSPALGILKEAEVPGGTANVVGEVITYTIWVWNAGNVTLTGVTVVDSLVSDLTRVADDPGNNDDRLDVGETWVYTATHTVTLEDIVSNGGGDGFINNTATADSDQTDPQQKDSNAVRVTQDYIVITPDKANCSKPYVHVVHRETGELLYRFLAYEESYRGGVRVATGDVTGDGMPEIITAPGRNHEPWVKVFQFDPVADEYKERVDLRFLAFANSFTGGVDVAVGNVVVEDGLGRNDIVVAMSYMGSRVAVFENTGSGFAKEYEFSPFGSSFKGGATVEVADMGTDPDGDLVLELDGKAEIVVGNEAGMSSAVRIFENTGTQVVLVRSFSPFMPTFRGGVSLDVALINGDDFPDIIVGTGITGGSEVQVLDGMSGTNITPPITAYHGQAESYLAPVHVAAIANANDGRAALIMTAQGSDGTTRLIRSYDAYTGFVGQFYENGPEGDPDFCGAYFLADLGFGPADSQPEQTAAPVVGVSPVGLWTNPATSPDITGDGTVSALDALVGINFINIRSGDTSLPAQQSTPPLFLDSNGDGAITGGDVLVVINFLNLPPLDLGEGEASDLVAGIAEMSSLLPSTLDLAARSTEFSAPNDSPQRIVAVHDAALVPKAEWSLPVAHEDSPGAADPADPWVEELDVFTLEPILEEIALEIATSRLGS